MKVVYLLLNLGVAQLLNLLRKDIYSFGLLVSGGPDCLHPRLLLSDALSEASNLA